MKIIYYSPHPTHDIVSEVGYSTHQRETISAMRKLGHEVFPVIMGGTEKAVVEAYHEEISGPSGIRNLLRRLLPTAVVNALKDLMLIQHDRRAAAELKKAIELHRPDLVYERNEYMQDKGTLLCRRLGIRHFLEVNSPCVEEMREFEGPSLLHFAGHRKERRKLRNTNRIFAVSGVLRDYLKEKYSVTEDITVIPNCINPEKKIPEISETNELRSRVNPDGRNVIGFVGSIFPYHGVDKLIRAFELLLRQRGDIRLLIVGGGALKQELEAMASDLLPAGSYEFTGRISHRDVMKYISIFDLAVMPASNWYGSPVKVLEYGLAGKIVIAPDNGPMRDLIVNGEEGILTGPSVEELAEGLLLALEQPGRSSAMAEAFHKKILKEFTWVRQAEKILA